MSDKLGNSQLQSNEEVIEELTKDIKDYCVSNSKDRSSNEVHNASDSLKDSLNSDPESTVFDNAHKSSDSEEDNATEKNDLNDYINEEELIQVNSKFTDEEKLERHKKALELKVQGNTAHKSDEYLVAIQHYTEALRMCPIDNKTDRAILFCNRAASKIQLKYKKSALDDCSKAIELNPNYVRAYLRRAKLYEEMDKLDESLEDYKKVLEFDQGHPESLKASIRLPPLINERNEKMKTEMLGKLKDLGNMILKPFGLSTNNFQLQQDPNSGGYSINFQQNPK